MDLNDSTKGPMMVSCEHLKTGFHKIGEFLHKLSGIQERSCILELFVLHPQKKIPLDRGGDDTLASSILPTVLLPSPLFCQLAEGACQYQHSP